MKNATTKLFFSLELWQCRKKEREKYCIIWQAGRQAGSKLPFFYRPPILFFPLVNY
jgi:hypothetical protein